MANQTRKWPVLGLVYWFLLLLAGKGCWKWWPRSPECHRAEGEEPHLLTATFDQCLCFSSSYWLKEGWVVAIVNYRCDTYFTLALRVLVRWSSVQINIIRG